MFRFRFGAAESIPGNVPNGEGIDQLFTALAVLPKEQKRNALSPIPKERK
jgi:hypothetical protein